MKKRKLRIPLRKSIAIIITLLAGTTMILFFAADLIDHQEGWTMVVIDENIDKPLYPAIVDINGNGKLDIVVASGDGPTEGVYWYRLVDQIQGNWICYTIDNNTVSGIDNAHAITVIDMNNDGIDDVISCGHHSNEVAWYSRTNADGTNVWTKHIIDDNCTYAHNTAAGDIKGDGHIEVVAVAEVRGDLYLYEQAEHGNPYGIWNRTTIDNDLAGAFRVYLADVNNDTKLDIIATGNYKYYYYWYENPNWTRHQINEVSLKDSRAGSPWDVDMDGDHDIVAVDMDNNEVIWYELDSSNPTGYWRKHLVDDSIDSPYDIAVADIDGNGKNDIIATGYGTQSTIRRVLGWTGGSVVWYSDSDPTGEWTKHYIGSLLGPRNINIYDLDEDGDLDIIIGDNGPDGRTGKLVYFVNELGLFKGD
ncbi:hypothetical protein C5S29_10820 [ANME-1 cluster archaeon GoMg3.2]|nr:hypothetical protein [ANME-1 cluster archaeon GoMg3.2]